MVVKLISRMGEFGLFIFPYILVFVAGFCCGVIWCGITNQ